MSFKIIPDFPNYRINVLGEVQSCYKPKTSIVTNIWRPVKPVLDKGINYYLVTLCHNGIRKNKRIHRLIMESFVSNPLNLKQINHIDGNKLNNSINNLEWCTPKQNSEHAHKIGLCGVGIKATEIPILMFDVNKTTFIKEFSSLHSITRETGICWQNVWKVCNKLRRTAGGYHWEYKNV